MAIQWTGLFTNTGYSSANNKTQDDAVTGMQDTLYVTGPGYGAYEAVVKLYNSTGAVVATVNVSGGGGAFSAPPPVRFVDNGTVYSYSLEVVRGYIPAEDADGIVIRLVGGASKRYPSPMAVTPSGDVAVAGAVTVGASGPSSGGRLRIPLNRRLRVGTFTDSTNNCYSPNDGQPSVTDLETIQTPIPATGILSHSMGAGVMALSWTTPLQWVANGGVDGETTTQALARSDDTPTVTRKAMQDISAKRLDVLFINGASINDLTGLDVGDDIAGTVAGMIARQRRMLEHFSPTVGYVFLTGICGAENTGWSQAKGSAVRSAVVLAWKQSAALAAEFPNVLFFNPNGIVSDNGVWRPGCNVEATQKYHPSGYAGYLLAKEYKSTIDALYEISNQDEVLYDLLPNWFTPTGSAPNVKPSGTSSSAAGGGSAVVGASTVANGEWTHKITTTGNPVECLLFTVSNLKTLLAGMSSGDKFYTEVDIDCYDEAGNKIPFRAQGTTALYEAGNVGSRIIVQGACNVDSARLSSLTARLDRDASSLGTSSSFQVRIYPDRVGETTFVIKPPRIRREYSDRLPDHILYEANAGYQGLGATAETQFAAYTIPAGKIRGDFFLKRRMICEEFMAGVNFAAATARLTLNQYWNGVLVQQITVNPQLTGVQGFGAGQNKALDINTQIRVESGTTTACAIRGHVAYSSSFNGATIWGDKNEYSYGQVAVDVTNGVNVVWKYQWNAASNLFYFDHLKVTW